MVTLIASVDVTSSLMFTSVVASIKNKEGDTHCHSGRQVVRVPASEMRMVTLVATVDATLLASEMRGL
ncbi:hypothetical protein E2C01_038366 [Portunus trituberculatus]|uniref:Uncharacterized protein n=1 Tax=Portunus trituberculatus TaxID=210409 RepID=A0A5B7FGL9_PORTR|nr:hypothetical protein [Portunus trituberculatus]